MIGKDVWLRLQEAKILKKGMSESQRKYAIKKAGPWNLMSIRSIGPDKAYILLHYAGWKIDKEELNRTYERIWNKRKFEEIKGIRKKQIQERGLYFNPEEIKIFVDMLGFNNRIKYQAFKPAIGGEKLDFSIRNIFVNNAYDFIKYAKIDNGYGLVCVGINEHKKDANINSTVKDIEKINVLSLDVDVKKTRKRYYVSTEGDHEHAIDIAHTLKADLEKKGFTITLINDSGNGAHIYIKVNIKLPEDLDKEKWEQTDIYKRLITLENELRDKFKDNVVTIDFITKDIVRRMKVPGTTNVKDIKQKEDRPCKIIYKADDYKEKENTRVFEKIKPAAIVQSFTLDDKGVKKINNAKLRKIFENDEKLSDLYNGEWQKYGYESRSNAEQALITRLVRYGLPNKQIYQLMQKCGIGKWQEKDEGYKRLTIGKARGFVKTRKVDTEIKSEDLKKAMEKSKKLGIL